MIIVTQGLENGVGLEIFIKALLCLHKQEHKKFKLFIHKNDLIKTLETLRLKYSLHTNHFLIAETQIQCEFLNPSKLPHSTSSLVAALKKIQSTDILLTLPTSKDQLVFNNKQVNGYTEFFRHHFQNLHLSMNFLAPRKNLLLLTDHISISKVGETLHSNYILDKLSTTLDNLSKFREIKDIYFSGIDPHCGENGQISNLDSVFPDLIKKCELKYPTLKFHGPYAADTLHLKYESRTDQLFVYAYHDQGLCPFKFENGLIGVNLTLGLPFIRVSVDHGTAVDLFGQNRANYQGMLFLMQETLKWA